MKQRKLQILICLLSAVLFTTAGCARYKDAPSGGVKTGGGGFTAFNLVDLQKPGGEDASRNKDSMAENNLSESRGSADSDPAEKPHTEAQDDDYARLRPFGHEFFRGYSDLPADEMAKGKQIFPVPRQYRIVPGENIILLLGNPPQKKHDLFVDSGGKIDIAGYGPVFVSGMTFEEMSAKVIGRITEKTPRMPVDISMSARNTITVFFQGEVNSPAPHTIGAFATVTEALRLAGGPKDTGSVRDIKVRRKGITVAVFDLYEFLLKGIKFRDITLMNEDEIVVPVRGRQVGISGAVERPAIYELKDGDELEALIVLAGGVLPDVKDLKIQIRRPEANGRKIIYEARADEIRSGKSAVPALKSRDIISVFSATEKEETRPIAVDDASTAAPAADESKPQEDIAAQEAVPLHAQKFVTLTGEFKRPGRYSIQKGEKLSSVIERAGGYTGSAYLRGAYFTRESVRRMQRQKLAETTQRLRQSFFPAGFPPAGNGSGSIQDSSLSEDKLLQGRFIEYMESLEATGRLSVNIAHLRLLKGSAHDIEMENDDELHLPQKSAIIYVIGAVMSEGPRVYQEAWDYREYIEAAGGLSRNAAEENIFVVKVDGSVRKLYRSVIQWSNKDARWEITAFGKKIRQIEAGDIIVVPERDERIAWLKGVKDVPSLVMNTAVLTGTVLKLW
ncbi:MAG TPA: SLBB domain-containing protein [Smithellaceae bacterium]|nr:SLBB domain-containing protein [Smithellaceae bacterium]